MTSSLFGIYNAQRSLLINQAAINLINTNISNMNTEGYSKQRLEISQQTIRTSESHLPLVASQSGAGATIDNISRNRDTYIDGYFRKENSDLAYYNEYNNNTLLIEDITNEMGNSGISKTLNEFYTAAQELSNNPTDAVTRTNFIQKAIDVATKFNYVSDQLDQLRTHLVGDISTPSTLSESSVKLSCDDLNTQLKSLAELNSIICTSTAQGVTPNNLLDQRDLILDKISEFIPATITYGHNNLTSISLNGVDLVNGTDQVGFFTAVTGNENNPAVVKIQDKNGNDTVTNAKSLLTSGKIGAILDIGGSDSNKLTIKGIMDDLNILARGFAKAVNDTQMAGRYIDKSVSPSVLVNAASNIFVETTGTETATYANLDASNIMVNQTIIDDPFKVAAAKSTNNNETGDGSNALDLSKLRNLTNADLGNVTVEGYLNATVGNIGILSKNIYDNYKTQNSIVEQVSNRRESAMGVNLDEELTDLVKYQRAYEASARIFNIVNETIEKIINLGA